MWNLRQNPLTLVTVLRLANNRHPHSVISLFTAIVQSNTVFKEKRLWNYSDKVMDHSAIPRNWANRKPDGVGSVGSLAARRPDPDVQGWADKRIVDVKFQTFGCASAIASSRLDRECCRKTRGGGRRSQ